MLKAQKLDPRAIVPTVSNPGEDLGYDLYALETVVIGAQKPTLVRTGIAAVFTRATPGFQYGLLIRDRSSMAMKGLYVTAGVVDAGYRGEIKVVMNRTEGTPAYTVKAGDKIAQMFPVPVRTGAGVVEVTELPASERGAAGFGSSGVR